MAILNKFFILLFCMVLLVSSVSAVEWDNAGRYNEETKTMTIKNGCDLLGLVCFGEDIAKIQLQTSLIQEVSRGYGKVAQIEVSSFVDYNNAFKELELFDKRKENKKFLRDYDYKVLSYKTILVNDYENVYVGKSLNGSSDIYENQIVGNHEEQKEVWTKLTPADFKKNENLTIGIFTEVKKDDYVEWIPNFFGVRIDEWAIWTENLNSQLVGYWNFDEGSGTVANDVRGNIYDGTLANGTSWLTGKLGNGVYLDGVDDLIYIGDTVHDGYDDWNDYGNNWTVSFWYKSNATTSNEGIIVKADLDAGGNYGQWSLVSNGASLTRFLNQDSTQYDITNVGNGVWKHIVLTYNQSYYNIYVDGDLEGTQSLAPNVASEDSSIVIGIWFNVGQNKNMAFDELGYWNRSIQSSEVTDLYNGGVGITYPLNPVVTLVSPIDNFNTSNPEITFNGTISAVTPDNVTYYLDDVGNETNTTGILDHYQFTKIISEGTHTWNYEACSSLACSNGTERTFTIDQSSPIINITYPTETIDYHVINNNLSVNWTVSDLLLDTCILEYEGVNRTVTCLDNQTQINITNLINKTIIFYVNDSVGNVNSSSRTWEYLFIKYNVSFDNQTFEGSQEIFTANINLSEGNTISEAIFYYNNTNYTTTIDFSGGEYLITSSITVPLVESATNFSLGFYVVISGQTYNLETFKQEVLSINMSVCGPGGNQLLNMTLYEEETKTKIIGDIEFNAQAISQTSNEIIDSIELNSLNISFLAICLSPQEAFENLYLDAEIKYSSDDYEAELYNIQKADISNYPQNLSLFDILSNKSTKFLIKYQDDNLISVEGAVIQLQRKYISENIFEIVEAPLTSDIGTAIVHINLDTNKYQATVVKDGIVLDIFDNLVFHCENELLSQCTENLFGRIDSQNNVPLTQLEDFSYSISPNSSSNTITTLFAIPSGTPSSVNIALTQRDQFGNETLCNQTIVSSGGSIDCTYVDTIGDSFLFLEISKDGLLKANEGYVVIESSGFDWLDNNFIIVLILLLSLVGMAFASPEIIVIIGIVVMIISGAFWLINGVNFVIGLGSIAWLLVGAIILIYKMAKQEDR